MNPDALENGEGVEEIPGFHVVDQNLRSSSGEEEGVG